MTTSVMKQITPGGAAYFETQTASTTVLLGTQTFINACGNYLYSIISIKNSASQTLSADLTINSSTGEIKLYTASQNTVGTHTATVTVSLVNYPSIT